MKIISPIAIDFGAKKTGVYYARYPKGTDISQIRTQGKIKGEVLEWGDNYTALLRDRTANRHARRGYQRKKLAKRLLVLVLEKHFNFPAKQHTQAIGFLLNRRGFTFLDEEYSKEYLKKLPNDTWKELPDEVTSLLGGQKNIADNLNLTTNDPEKIERIFDAIKQIKEYQDYQKEETEIKWEFVYLDYIEKINKACDIVINGKKVTDDNVKKNEKDKQKLSATSNWIIGRLNNPNLIVDGNNNQTNLIAKITPQNATQLQQSLPDFEKERSRTKEKQKENNKSIWAFNIAEFNLNDSNEKKLNDGQKKAHLHHLCYAIYKINHELTSGARRRSKYFDEINNDLKKISENDFLDDKHSPQYLKNFALAVKEHEQLNADKIYQLVCHISNFELRPLRAYFNDKTPIKKGKQYKDAWNLLKISDIFSRWILKQWRVNEDNDGKEKADRYKELRDAWKAHSNQQDVDVIDFWLNNDPSLTIPPYQDQNNRRPPKCQSLILNSEYLCQHYSQSGCALPNVVPQWITWLEQLKEAKETIGYQNKLADITSGKKKPLLIGQQNKLRELQFILDTTKDIDPLKLNTIWSHYHRLQKPSTTNKPQGHHDETVDKMKQAIEESALPDCLKAALETGLNSKFKERTFGHFINNYYQSRCKARDARYFLFQSKKNKWESAKILTLCLHKPQQKKNQMGRDIANIFGIDYATLQKHIKNNAEKTEAEKTEAEKMEYWLTKFLGLESLCKKAATAQKEHKGYLGEEIKTAIKLCTGQPKPPPKHKELWKLDRKAKDIAKDIANNLWSDADNSHKAKKFESVFSFAQIHNIAFKERSGFSKTCPVCSADNGERMQVFSPDSDKKHQDKAQASRLSALSIRLIDGVVMRICDKVANHIAKQVWTDIQPELQENKNFTIPLILEQNHFDYEPDLQTIKGNKSTKQKEENTNKEDRIKKDSLDICPYTGESLGDNGELDHIIPRSSKSGTMNDEANLIYCTKQGNTDKGENFYTLTNLKNQYQKKIFGTSDNESITESIYKTLVGCDNTRSENLTNKTFLFRYRNFANLDDDQQKAFRHALFLPKEDKLRAMVINTISNRNRTIVNGTQRYLAQIIADKLYAKAKRNKQAHLLEFDYFEPLAEEIYLFRKKWENTPDSPIRKFKKETGKEQQLYSHLIDAQMAFLCAAEKHKNGGSMGLCFAKSETITDGFDLTKIGENGFMKKDLNPKKSSNQKITDIEKQNSTGKQNLSKIFTRYVFKKNAIGERYKPISKFKDKLYLGYPQTIKGGEYDLEKYCEVIKQKEDIFWKIINNAIYYELTTDNERIKIYTIRRIGNKYKQIDKDSHKYFSELMPEYADEEKEKVEQIKLILKKCRYYVSKTEVINAPKVLAKSATKKFPFHKNWMDFDNAWKKEAGHNYKVGNEGKYVLETDEVKKKWDAFCSKEFPQQNSQIERKHRKRGRKFTMTGPGTSSGTVFRINRNGQDIYQSVPLDTNIVSKNNSNFLIKHSKNLTLGSATADRDLKKIHLKGDSDWNNYLIDSREFFHEVDTDSSIEVYLHKNLVEIKNFPLEKFKFYLNKYDETKETVAILTDNKAKQDLKNNPALIYAKKDPLDKSIKITTRDGFIRDIKINNDRIDFSLPFKSNVIENLMKRIGS